MWMPPNGLSTISRLVKVWIYRVNNPGAGPHRVCLQVTEAGLVGVATNDILISDQFVIAGQEEHGSDVNEP